MAGQNYETKAELTAEYAEYAESQKALLFFRVFRLFRGSQFR
jgi:hypothetical protein